MFPFLLRKEVKDEFAQENFVRIADYFAADGYVQGGFKFLEIVVDAAVTGFAAPHFLTYVPKDIVVTQNLNNVTLTWDYASFDATNVYFTTSGATTIRLLIGRI